MNRALPMVTLLPTTFHVAPMRREPTPGQRADSTAFARSKRARRAEWIARQGRRAAFIECERLSRLEASYLPLDFDPAD
ncbi:MAG: hypothetical protein ACREO4_06410 [Lysobacter sp.]